MGMELTVEFSGTGPAWSTIRGEMVALGFAPQMRMIDDMPAFPDEDPDVDVAEGTSAWKDLRISLGSGMVALRRDPGKFRIVVWGNADEALRKEQEAIAEACRRAVRSGSRS
jgi:hypothetical protein